MTAEARGQGSVTLMFTDIEGSTKLLERLRDSYGTLLEQQREILRAAFYRHDGHEVDTQGDSFFVAFSSAAEALACAVEIQRDLAAHEWPDGAQLRVRIGIHTGQPAVAATGYVGIDVHRGARIGAAAHGGQVLASEATRDATANAMPTDVELEALGLFRFKGLVDPLAVFEVHAPGLATGFPPIRTSPPEDEPPSPGEAPYKGLLRFDEDDADRFFGREELVAQIVAEVEAATFLAIVGASGSGKSSLVRAGVVRALRARAGGSLAVITPTADPTTQLLTALAGKPTFLVVDQFEELFTLTRDESARGEFIDHLMTAIADGLRVLITLRADFYENVAEYPDLRSAVAEHQLYIGPMEASDLRRVIEEPARRGGWEIAPGLVDLLLRDVGSEPGALPLLSHALLETWHHRRGSRMTLKAYFESGEVRGAIARTADRLYGELSSHEQQGAREVLLRLTELGEGTQDTRRRARLDELLPDGARREETEEVLRRLVDARLVTVDEGSAEVAHEALIREWPLLRDWLHQDREGLRTQRQITESTAEWEALNREPSLLFRGARLATAHEWADAHEGALTERERAFIDASIHTEEADARERAAQQQRALDAERRRADEQAASNRRLRRRAFILAGAVVLAAGLGFAALRFAGQASEQATRANDQASKAEQQRQTALSRQLAAQAAGVRDTNLDLSLLLSVESLHSADTVEARASLLAALQREPQLDTILAKTGRLAAGVVRADGREIAVIDTAGAVTVWDLVGRRVTSSFQAGNGDVNTLVMSADGSTLVAAAGGSVSSDGSLEGPGRLDAYDTGTGALRISFDACPLGDLSLSPDGAVAAESCNEGYRIYDVAIGAVVATVCPGSVGRFSPDSDRIAVGCADGAVNIYASRSGALLESLPHVPDVADLSLSDDGGALLVQYQGPDPPYAQTYVEWDLATGQPLGEWQGRFARFLPGLDGSIVVLTDSALERWELGNDAATATFDCAPGPVGGFLLKSGFDMLAVAEDGSRLAVVCSSGIEVLGLPELTPIETLRPPGMTFAVDQVAESTEFRFLPSGGLFTFSYNDHTGEGSVAIWDLDRTDRIAKSLTHFVDPDLVAYAVSPDLTVAAVVSNGETSIGLWDLAAQAPIGSPLAIPVTNNGPFAGFSADGRLLAVGAIGGPNIAIIEIATGAEIARVEAPAGGVFYSAISSDATQIAVGGDASQIPVGGSDKITIWDIASNTKALVLDQPGAPMAFSPDGKTLAVRSGGTATLWDLATGQQIGPLAGEHARGGGTVAFNSGGTKLATTSLDQTVAVWDVTTRQRIGSFLPHDAAVFTAFFSPDNRILATFAPPKTYLWDLALGQLIGTLPDAYVLGFSPDGTRLVASRGHDVVAYDLDPASWAASACAVAGRTLTEIEWARYLPDDPYRETCSAASAAPSATP